MHPRLRLHATGLAQRKLPVVLAVRKREAKKKEFFEAESAPSARELAKRARADGKLPP